DRRRIRSHPLIELPAGDLWIGGENFGQLGKQAALLREALEQRGPKLRIVEPVLAKQTIVGRRVARLGPRVRVEQVVHEDQVFRKALVRVDVQLTVERGIGMTLHY